MYREPIGAKSNRGETILTQSSSNCRRTRLPGHQPGCEREPSKSRSPQPGREPKLTLTLRGTLRPEASGHPTTGDPCLSAANLGANASLRSHAVRNQGGDKPNANASGIPRSEADRLRTQTYGVTQSAVWCPQPENREQAAAHHPTEVSLLRAAPAACAIVFRSPSQERYYFNRGGVKLTKYNLNFRRSHDQGPNAEARHSPVFRAVYDLP